MSQSAEHKQLLTADTFI